MVSERERGSWGSEFSSLVCFNKIGAIGYSTSENIDISRESADSFLSRTGMILEFSDKLPVKADMPSESFGESPEIALVLPEY
jgi:hypothetical protein